MRILYVEDNPVDADLTRRNLARHAPDLVVVHVPSLVEAQRCLQTDSDSYDLALVDLRLAGHSGLELLAWIRERRLSIAVVMLTGSGDKDAVVAALKAGADDYQIKGVEAFERLHITLQEAAQRFRDKRNLHARTLRVLYAEHNAADIELTRRHLARHAPHIRLTVVGDADAILRKLPGGPEMAPDFDVVLLDYHLPGIDALEALKALRLERKLEIPIVLVSGQGGETVVAQAMQLGVNDYLSKHTGYLFALPATLETVYRQAELVREQHNLRETSRRLAYLIDASPVILYTIQVSGRTLTPSWVSGNVTRLLGFPVEQALEPDWWRDHLHPEDSEAAQLAGINLVERKHLTHVYRFFDSAGRVRWIHDELRLSPGADGQGYEIIGAWRDISESKQAEQVQQTRAAVLDSLAGNEPLKSILAEICIRLEQIRPQMRVSIMLLDPRSARLFTGAAPSLPESYNEAVAGLEARIGNGSCATAAALGKPVVVEDVQHHAYWQDYIDLAAAAGIRACWSIPFNNDDDQVLGTFAIYYSEPSVPNPDDQALIGEFAQITRLAVQRFRANTALRQAAQVFASTGEGIVITDLEPRILSANRAFSDITGYAHDEVVGMNPNLVRSGRHDDAFYQAMWQSIAETGHWRGEIWNRRKNGEVFPQMLTISTVHDDEGQPSHYVGVTTDISKIKESERRLEHLAHHDPLTTLPNRLLFNARLDHALTQAARNSTQGAVMFLDLDRFKQINDSFGHQLGDRMLREVADRLRYCVRTNDTVARMSGDEFTLLLEDIKDAENAAVVAEKIRLGFSESFDLDGQVLYVTASIGISIFPGDADNSEALLRNADTALYAAKKQGRNNYAFYNKKLTSTAYEQAMLELGLREAVSRGELRLHFQPQLDLLNGRLIGAEALIRWQHPEFGTVAPNRFIPLAEETGLIHDIGAWVINEACLHARSWRDRGLEFGRVAVNIAGPQITRPGLLQQVRVALESNDLPPACLELEVTEGFIMDQAQESIELLLALRRLGVRLSIDDFGTGYSSLAYLKQLPIDALKIDQSFVRDVPQDQNDNAIVKAIIALGLNLGLEVIAEGVETAEQMEFLRANGCTKGQGYLYSRPLPADDFARFVETACGGDSVKKPAD